MRRLLIASLVFAGLGVPAAARAESPPRMEGVAMTTARSPRPVQAEFSSTMRRLWEGQTTFTRNFIISSLAGLGDADSIALRLLKNQDDIGNAIKPFYGAAAGDRLAVLLRDHIMIAADVVKAVRDRDADALAARQLAWAANADAIAAFFVEVNPAWSRSTLTSMLRRHLELTTLEMAARMKRDWSADIAAYDQSHQHMVRLADVLTEGVVKQHRRRFVR